MYFRKLTTKKMICKNTFTWFKYFSWTVSCNSKSWRQRNMISSDLFSSDMFGHVSSWMCSFVYCQWYDTPLFICLSKQVRKRADLGGFLTFRFLVDFSHSDFRGFLINCGNATPLCLSVWPAASSETRHHVSLLQICYQGRISSTKIRRSNSFSKYDLNLKNRIRMS